MSETALLVKRRVIALRAPCDPGLRAPAAMYLLNGTQGVHDASLISDYHVEVAYDLYLITFEQIETALAEVGFHLDNSLMYKLKRALYYYTETNERNNLGLTRISCSQNCARQIFASRYRQLEHGCRDNRPDHLRRYL